MSSAGTGEEGAGIGERYVRACLQRFVWQRGRGRVVVVVVVVVVVPW
jgi:hypothetical protein